MSSPIATLPTVQLPDRYRDVAITTDQVLNRDLVPAFIDVLAVADPARARSRRQQYQALVGDDPMAADIGDASSQVDELRLEIHEDLQSIAPAGTYFGAPAYNGACFGFWSFE